MSGCHGKINLGNAKVTSIKQISLLEYFSEPFKILNVHLNLQKGIMVLNEGNHLS